jgi:hypothetical protein
MDHSLIPAMKKSSSAIAVNPGSFFHFLEIPRNDLSHSLSPRL